MYLAVCTYVSWKETSFPAKNSFKSYITTKIYNVIELENCAIICIGICIC